MRAVVSGVLAGVAGVLAALGPVASAQPAPAPADPAAAPADPAAAPADPAVAPAAPAPAPAAAAPAPASGSATPAASARSGRHRGPWLLIGGSLALVTTGAILAYSADAAERDVEDLYVGFSGTPPPFNSTTRRLYDDAIDEGHRYQTLSIASFSLAGALAAAAAVWLVLDRGEHVTIAPAVSPGGAGVSTAIRF